MISKSEFRDRYYIIYGLMLGTLMGVFGGFLSGFYFWGREHPEEQFMFWYCLFVFILLVLFFYVTLRRLEKKFK